MLVGGTDMTKVTVALPTLNEALSLGTIESLWTADIYALAAGVVLVPAAVVADRYGRKRLYLLGLGVAIVSAMLAGLAPTGAVLIAARIGQGVGSALLIAGTVAIIRVTFLGLRSRAVAYGVWLAGFSTGSALGPLLGGGLVDLAQWQWVFWINVPILLAALIAAWIILPESTNPDPPTLDALSAGLSAAAVGLLIAGLKWLTQPGVPSWLTWVAAGAGTVAAVLFVIRQLRLPRPFLDVRLFTDRLLAVSAAVIAVTVGVFNGTLYLLTLRYQVIGGLSAIDTGITLIPLAATMAAGGLLSPLLQRRLAQQHVIVGGLVLVSFGFLLLAAMPGAGQMVGMTTFGLGSGIVMTFGANALMSTATEERTADAGAIQESAFALGGGTGIAVFGVLAIHFAGKSPGGSSLEATYGPGTDTALGLAAFFYTFFVIAASLIILSTTTTRRHQKATHLRAL
ncbi:MFS transporter, DHA2 family, multidrug resistance protein [Brevibacterium sandarakinum]|uniref:MFS transporter, DHA2 family, multidrug resistance protein n=1 Tax=Brevibacterium sandarakinum TaxID=629680 RepID=A0A1H1XBW1_BRESA|nr:MFS transporter [Brevibacterium sandarakinum]SDT06757.1 MFS transporter, DHA2 family, multidrug resistance protein [Brevibacterium sandarakinum]